MKLTIPFPVLAALFIFAGFGSGWMLWVEVVLK